MLQSINLSVACMFGSGVCSTGLHGGGFLQVVAEGAAALGYNATVGNKFLKIITSYRSPNLSVYL